MDSVSEGKEIKLHTAVLDGKRVAYCDETEFLVQVGYDTRRFKTVATFKGNLAGALIHYRGINIASGYKKRLLMPSAKRPVLARVSL